MPDSNFMWDLITGKTSRNAFEAFKHRYPDMHDTPQIPSLPMAGITIPKRDEPDMSGIGYNLQGPKKKEVNPLIPAGLATVGGLASSMANIGRPDVGLNALGGALQGAGYGAMLGPLGAGVGGLIGGIAGLVGGGINQGRYDDQNQAAEKGRLKAATVYGTDIGSYAKGGNVGGDPNELKPIQTQKGEVIALSDFHIFRSKATQTHKQMASDFITDLLPGDAFVGTTKKALSKDKADKVILGYDIVSYEEDGNSSKPNEHTLGEIFRKKKMSPAEVLDIIKNKFPIVDLQSGPLKYDPFAKKANIRNLAARMPYINAVVAQSSKK